MTAWPQEMDREMQWVPAEGIGAEHLRVRLSAKGVTAEAVVIGSRAGVAFGLIYRLTCDPLWRVREAEIALVGGTRRLHLHADGAGKWQHEDGTKADALHGCIDVDIAATPFTNTLPIRRLPLAAGEARNIRVAYVAVPALALSVAPQRYTCLKPFRRYRYESLDSGFTRDLPVDADGLLVDYPGLFRRPDSTSDR